MSLPFESLKRLKAEIFTYGIKFKPEDFEKLRMQNPYNQNRSGLSAGRFIELDGNTVVNVPFWEKFVQYSPFSFEDGQLYRDEKPVNTSIDFVATPRWINETLPSGVFAGQIIQPHGKGNLATMVFGCDLQTATERCRFCTASNFERRQPLSVEDLTGALDLALKENPQYSLSINAGTLKTEGRGLELIIPMVRRIRNQFPTLGLMLEIAPPQNPNMYQELASANGSGELGLMLNLNFWSDSALNIVEPGKNKMISKDEYLKTWKEAIAVFGRGQVSSCILCGIEAEDYTKQAIDTLTSQDVIPEIIMFRPTIGQDLGQVPLDPELFLRVSDYARQKMLESRIVPAQVGCINCGGCSLTTMKSFRR